MIRSKFAVAVAIVSFCALPLVACSGGGDSGPSVSKQCESLMNANEAGTKKIEAIKDDDATASGRGSSSHHRRSGSGFRRCGPHGHETTGTLKPARASVVHVGAAHSVAGKLQGHPDGQLTQR